MNRGSDTSMPESTDVVHLSPCAIRALASVLDPENFPAIDLADLRTIFFPGAQRGVLAPLQPPGDTIEAWHGAIIYGLASAGRTSSGSQPPHAMLLCVDQQHVAVRDMSNALAAMRRIAPDAAILAARGAWAKEGSEADDCSACLFAIWRDAAAE